MRAVAGQAALLGVALLLGILFDQWFRTRWLGLGATLYVALLVAALLGLSALARRQPARRNLWLLAPLLLFAAVPTVRDADLLVALNVLAVLALLVLVAQFYAGGALDRLGPLGYVVAAVEVAFGTIGRPVEALGSVAAALGRRTPPGARSGRGALPIARGLLLAAPFLVVFTALLASADVVFGAYVDRITRFDLGWDLSGVFEHGPLVVLVGWLVAGGLLHALRTHTAPALATDAAAGGARPPSDAASPESGPWLAVTLEAPWPIVGFVEATTVLATIDVLFGAFVAVQLAYLFGGRETLDVAGLTYAEYARRGFFELLAVAAIALPLVFGLDWVGRRDTARQRRLFQALGGAMVALTLVILASAMLRMMLYEDAYGYTHLRLYSHAFMVWLAALCLLFLAALVLERRRWLTFAAVLSVVVGLAALDLLDPDRFIAEQNLRRYEAGRPLDARHLTDLSADAAPVVLRALDVATARDDAAVRDALGGGLRRTLLGLDETMAAPWPAANLARASAHAALSARRAELETYPLGRRRGG